MNIIFLFVSLFMLFFNWQRLIFVLISLEFIMLSLFLMLANYISEMMFFYFMCFSVISSVLGILIIVGSIKTYGDDQCVF